MCKCSNKIGNFITLRHFPSPNSAHISPQRKRDTLSGIAFCRFRESLLPDYSSASVASSGNLNSVKPASTNRLNHATAFLMSEA